jgi:hypothetical protein
LAKKAGGSSFCQKGIGFWLSQNMVAVRNDQITVGRKLAKSKLKRIKKLHVSYTFSFFLALFFSTVFYLPDRRTHSRRDPTLFFHRATSPVQNFPNHSFLAVLSIAGRLLPDVA